jgi:hypothetical protein
MPAVAEGKNRTDRVTTRAYFETSALDFVVKRRVPVSAIRSQLENRGLTACVGTLTINECAQPILSDRGDAAVALFEVIRELQPRFLADPSDLYEQETRLLRDGTPVNPHPSDAQEAFVRNEVGELADGRINLRLLELVQDRRKVKFEEWPTAMEKCLAVVKELRRDSPVDVPRFGTFGQFEDFFRGDLPRFVACLPGLSLSIDQADAIAAEINLYPAIRTTVYFWCNVMFICIKDGRAPSVDKVDDYRHVVEASYCDAFITNDGQLLRSISRLHPSLTPFHVDAFTTSIYS